MHVVVAANRWAEIRPALLDNLGARLELRLNDAIDSLVSRAAAAALPADVPGRALTSDGLHVQLALPRVDGRADDSRHGRGAEHDRPPGRRALGRRRAPSRSACSRACSPPTTCRRPRAAGVADRRRGARPGARARRPARRRPALPGLRRRRERQVLAAARARPRADRPTERTLQPDDRRRPPLAGRPRRSCRTSAPTPPTRSPPRRRCRRARPRADGAHGRGRRRAARGRALRRLRPQLRPDQQPARAAARPARRRPRHRPARRALPPRRRQRPRRLRSSLRAACASSGRPA